MTQKNTPPGLVQVENLPIGAAAIANFASGMSSTDAAIAANKGMVYVPESAPANTVPRPAFADQALSYYETRPELPDGVKEILPGEEPEPTAPLSSTAAPPSFVDSVNTPQTAALEAQIAVAQTSAKVLESEEQGFRAAMDRLNLTEERVFKILDDVILQGGSYYEQVVIIPASRRVPTRIVAVFKTRSVDDYRVVNGAVLADQPQFDTDVSASTSRANLACSLVYYGTEPSAANPAPKNAKRFFDAQDKRVISLTDALTWVGGLNQQLFSLLANELYKFDQRVMLATSEYAMRSFL